MKKYDEIVNIWENDKKHSHWIDSSNKQSWEEVSQAYNKIFDYFFRKYELCKDKLVDFGSGGGCNIKNLYPFCKEYNAVDISQNNLDEFKKVIDSYGYSNYNLIRYNPSYVHLLRRKVNEVDLIVSTAVFQHFPDFDFSLKILREFHKMLNEKGHILIQYRYSEIDREADNYTKNYNYIFGLSFSDKKIKEQLELSNFELLEICKFKKPSKTYKWLIAKKV